MEEILKQLGYLKSESSVYVRLLEIGPNSAGIIAKKTKLNRVSVYKALDKLINDGLVSYVIKANRKTFKAANPSKIKKIIEERKKELQKFEKNIPELIEVYTRKKEKVGTEIYEGVKGLKTILEDFLKTAKDEWLVLGGPKKAELLGGFFKDLNQRRAKKKVKLKIVYNKDAKGLIDIRKKQPLTEVRIMPDNFVTPASIEIVGNKCAIVLYSPVIIAFGINSKEVADSFRQYFELIWKSSERI